MINGRLVVKLKHYRQQTFFALSRFRIKSQMQVANLVINGQFPQLKKFFTVHVQQKIFAQIVRQKFHMVLYQSCPLVKSRLVIEKSPRDLLINKRVNVRNFFENVRLREKFF